MSTSHDTQKDHAEYIANRSWFIAFCFVMLFALVWAVIGASALKMLLVGVAFALFLRAGINLEMSARKLDPHAH